jgi:hypothetical protein
MKAGESGNMRDLRVDALYLVAVRLDSERRWDSYFGCQNSYEQ